MDLQNEKCVMVIDESLPPWHHSEHGGNYGYHAGETDAGGCRRGCV